MNALARAARGAARRIKGWRARRAVARFFRLPYAERVAAVQTLYAHRRMRPSFDRYFAARDRIAVYPQPFYDLILAYAEVLQPATILQVGCFTATESRWLTLRNCPARLIASDFDPERLRYLEARFAGTAYARIELRKLDLESPAMADLAGIDMIVCNAVLSNVQPEGLDRFLAAVAAGSVACLVLSDIYSGGSLVADSVGARSLPSAADRNWFHPYLALAARHGLAGFFLPDFTTSSFEAARGIFVLHRHLAADLHDRAVAQGWRHYLARQPKILADQAQRP
jgi:hypothetical protein